MFIHLKRVPRSLLYLFLGLFSSIIVCFPLRLQAQTTQSPIEVPQLAGITQQQFTEWQNWFTRCIPKLNRYPDRTVIQYAEFQGEYYFTLGMNIRSYFQELQSEGEAGVMFENGQEYWEVSVAINPTQPDLSQQCRMLELAGGIRPNSWLEIMPESAAYTFALQEMQYEAWLFGGADVLRQWLIDAVNESHNTGDEYRLPVDRAWAYQQLGIQIPSNVPVYDPRQEQPQRR